MAERLVLVTGGAGFLAVHCIDQLLRRGFCVRASLRRPGDAMEVRAMLAEAGCDPGQNLSFAQGDLLSDAGWRAAATGCEFVLHVASPYPASLPRHEQDLLAPAREGTLRVLRAARDAGVRRVVLTSSFAAVGEGHPTQPMPFDESSWADLSAPLVTTYAKSKTLAEEDAWRFVARDGGGMELSVVNPVTMLGPALGPRYTTSLLILQRMLDGTVPALPRFSLAFVDVRDVAELHLRTMLDPAASGERFLAASGAPTSIAEVAAILRQHMGSAARRVPTREMPDWMVRGLALVRPELKLVLPLLGRAQHVTAAKARSLLGWSARPTEEAVLAGAVSLLRLGLLKESAQQAA